VANLDIGDAVQLDVNRVDENKLLLRTENTGVPVYCILSDLVIKALDAAPHSRSRYFFWTGKSTIGSAKGKWQRRLQRLFELGKVPNGHPIDFATPSLWSVSCSDWSCELTTAIRTRRPLKNTDVTEWYFVGT
jgi:hypothetical protein